MLAAPMALEDIRVASPCHASWDEMTGDDRARFCGSCQKHVYNLSGMSRSEAEALVNRTEGELCVRFYRRFDGTVLTADCPVGWRAARRRMWITGATAVGLVVAFLGLILAGTATAVGVSVANGWRPRWFADPNGPPRPVPGQVVPINFGGGEPPQMVMGDMCPPNIQNVAPPVPPQIAVPVGQK